MSELGKQLQTYRSRKKLTVSQVAMMLDVSPPSVTRWEKGEAEPNGFNRTKVDRLLKGQTKQFWRRPA